VSNLGVFDFNGPDHQMRAVSLHPGITPEEVRDNTSFEVHGLDKAAPTRLPTERQPGGWTGSRVRMRGTRARTAG